MTTRLRRFFIHGAALLLSTSAASSQSGVRVVHALSGAPPIAFFVDSVLVGADNLAEGSATRIVPVAQGNHRLTITAAGGSFEFAVIDTSVAIGADSVCTLVLSGSFDPPITRSTFLVEKHPSGLDSATTALRFVNLVLGLDTVDVGVAPRGVAGFEVDRLTYGSTSSPTRVPAADLVIRLGVSTLPLVYRGRGYLTGGGTTTVLLLGRFRGSSEGLLVVSLAENDTNAQTPLPQFSGLPLEEGMFRAVNVARDISPIDLIREGVSGDSTPMEFRFATAQRSDLLGPFRFLVTRAGSGRDQPLATIDLAIPRDSLTTLFIAMPEGVSEIPVPFVVTSALTPAPAKGRSRLRLLHASPDLGTIDVDLLQHDTIVTTMQRLGFGTYKGFVDIPSGSWTARWRASGSEYRFTGGVLADATITAIIDGTVADSSLGVDLLVENNLLEQEPMIALSRLTMSDVRVGRDRMIARATVLPNPTAGNARLAFRLDRAQPVTVVIYGSTGLRLHASTVRQGLEGMNIIPMDLEHLARGAYRIVVEDASGTRIAEGDNVIVR